MRRPEQEESVGAERDRGIQARCIEQAAEPPHGV